MLTIVHPKDVALSSVASYKKLLIRKSIQDTFTTARLSNLDFEN